MNEREADIVRLFRENESFTVEVDFIKVNDDIIEIDELIMLIWALIDQVDYISSSLKDVQSDLVEFIEKNSDFPTDQLCAEELSGYLELIGDENDFS